MPAFMEDEFSIAVSLPKENVFQITITPPRKTILDKQATISLKNRRFGGKCATKSTSVGTHTEAHICISAFQHVVDRKRFYHSQCKMQTTDGKLQTAEYKMQNCRLQNKNAKGHN